ncbi:LCP family protein [Streptomyces corynorhini]|uniref:LytR family transcriptional regulator n=1 Tax=Streptomyces corynorhini TaxID=2282652 RepID=A0A370BCN9_9ACTN|nr:LCP family protein [Streptomyces corynorhini]RDG39557.1 LytR family transcriptional regulator [Streptomyces corynorhini]
MDAHSRGQADDIDPADQWVLNPDTGNYELRLDHSTGQSPAPRATTDARTDPGPAAPATPTGDAAPAADAAPPRADVPGQRSRRAGKGPGKGQGANQQEPPPTAPGRRKRKAVKGKKKSGKKKALLWTGGALALVLVAGSAGGYLYYRHLNGNIATIDVAGAGSGGFKKGEAVNILLIGTDKRTGAGNEGYGDAGSIGHADTNLLFHVSKDRTNATVLSIPRDLITDIPDCETKTEDGTKVIPGATQQRFNNSLGQDDRDPGCTMRTTTEITGLEIDHFMMADFNAVKTLSTAVGGVEVCVDKDVDDKQSRLKLSKGTHKISGEDALAFVRTRHAFGNESDLSRIQTQQQFLGSMIREMKSGDTLTSPSKLFSLAEAATKALTVDTGIGSIDKLSELAKELAKVPAKNITFTTLPVLDNPAETVKATVILNEQEAKPLFSMMQNDVSLTEVKKKESAKEAAAKKEQAALLKGTKAAPADVRVDVFNGGGPQGSAQETLNWLQNTEGVLKSSNKGNAPGNVAKTTLEYAPNQADQARALAAMLGLPAAGMKPGTEDAVGLEAMKLTLGKDFKGAGVPITGAAKVSSNVQKVEADKQVCAK